MPIPRHLSRKVTAPDRRSISCFRLANALRPLRAHQLAPAAPMRWRTPDTSRSRHGPISSPSDLPPPDQLPCLSEPHHRPANIVLSSPARSRAHSYLAVLMSPLVHLSCRETRLEAGYTPCLTPIIASTSLPTIYIRCRPLSRVRGMSLGRNSRIIVCWLASLT